MFLVINLGLKSIRGIIFNSLGDQIYSKAFPVHTKLFNERVEQDATEWINLLNNILEEIRDNTDLANEIQYITVTTSSSCILGLDQNMMPVTPVLMVSDKRSQSISERIANDNFFIEQNKSTGLACSPSTLIPKALWFKENKPDIFEKVQWWAGAGEYLNYFFTNKFFTDPLNAGKSFYSNGQYQSSLISHFDFDVNQLPKVYEIGKIMPVNDTTISKFMLNPNCRFIISTYDAVCAVLGSSNGESTNGCDVSGTVTSVRVLRDDYLKFNSNILLNQPIRALGKFLLGASNNLGGGIIEWYKQSFYNESDPEVYFKMENSASKSKPGADGVLFLPYLLGERAPFSNPNASGTFFGLRRNSTQVQFSRAVFESTAYVSRDLIELIRSSGAEVKSLTVSGGLARFDLINQIKADVTNLPVYVLENFESTSIGAFVIMKIACGDYNGVDQALKDLVKIRKVIHPSTKNFTVYDDMYGIFKDLNNNLGTIYDKHSAIGRKQVIHENEIVKNL